MKEKPANQNKDVNNYMRYSGIGFQIAATIGVGIFIGYELDKWQKTKAPYYTISFATLFMIAAFYIGFKDLLSNK
jgi:ATP synthase protein I